MGKRWRKYEVRGYRLGALFNEKLARHEAVVCWRDDDGPHRRRLGVFSEAEGRIAVDRFVGSCEALKDRAKLTVGRVFAAYRADRERDGKLVAAFDENWKALEP